MKSILHFQTESHDEFVITDTNLSINVKKYNRRDICPPPPSLRQRHQTNFENSLRTELKNSLSIVLMGIRCLILDERNFAGMRYSVFSYQPFLLAPVISSSK